VLEGNTVLVDLKQNRPIGQLELQALNEQVQSALVDVRPLYFPSAPNVVMYFSGIPAFDAICTNNKSVAKDDTPPVAGKDLLLISAAHGVYRYFDSNGRASWMTQRNEINGIVEDFLTPDLASRLQALVLAQRPGRPHSVRMIRQAFAPAHPDSGRPWIEMGANYTLQRLIPQRMDIWGFSCDDLPKMAADPERDRKFDLNSRPLYANHLNADGVIHLHTNASCRRLKPSDPRPTRRSDCGRGMTVDENASGMLVFYNEDSAPSKRLADLIACTSRDAFRTAYPDHAVFAPRTRTDLAELNLAKRASVIVELGFHTNPADAALLKSEAFQTLSMRAIATAWDKFVRNEACPPSAP
jgi:hypothetical protein